MSRAVGIGLDLDDVVQRAASSTGGLLERPAFHLRLPTEGRTSRRRRATDLPAHFAGAALALARIDACGLVSVDVHDTFALWRRAAACEPARDEVEAFRWYLRDLLEGLDGGDRARIAVAIPDPADEVAQERWLRLLAGIGRVDPVWRPVLAVLGLASRPGVHLPNSFEVVAVELGWGVLRANVLKVERDPRTGLHVPERRRPGVEVRWDGLPPPRPEERISPAWVRDADGRLVRGDHARPAAPPEVGQEVEEAAEELAAELAGRLDRGAGGPVVWLLEGALAGAPCGQGRLAGAVVRGLRRVLPRPARIEVASAADGLVARGGAECARRLALGLPAWWDALPQLEINRVDGQGVAFVPLVDARRIAGGEEYRHTVPGFALPGGAERMVFVLLHEGHSTARRLEQPLPARLPREIPVRLEVRQRPAQGRARVDVVPVDPTPDFRPVRLDWDLLEDTGWTREQALAELRQLTGLRFPPKTPVPSGLHHWRETRLPEILARFLEIDPGKNPDAHVQAVRDCLDALRARRPPGGAERVGVVSSDGEPHPALHEAGTRLLDAFRAKLDRDIRALPFGSDIRRRLVLAGAWLYAGAPQAVYEDLRRAFRQRDYPRGFVQAVGRCFADEDDVRLFFDRCTEVFRRNEENTDWTKALGQILIYRENACLWLDAERARLCLYGTVRELQRAIKRRGELRPQIFNNAILALLGLLRVRRHLPSFLLGHSGDPIPQEIGQKIREGLEELANRLDRAGRRHQWRAERVREVLKFVEGRGSDQLVAVDFDE